MFKYIPPAELHSVWFTIRTGLEIVLEKTKDSWIPEDVYCSIRTGSAQLFLIPNGFVVLQTIRDQWSNEVELHIWITYHDNNEVEANKEDYEQYHKEIRKLAESVNARKITFASPRRWERHSGATIRHVTYEMEIQHG